MQSNDKLLILQVKSLFYIFQFLSLVRPLLGVTLYIRKIILSAFLIY